MTRVQPRPLFPSLPVPSDTGGVHIWRILLKAHRALAYHAEQSIVGLGFCFSDFATLEALLHKGPQSVTEIAHRIGLTAGSMSIALDRLARRGLVRRCAHPTDRRNRVIRLTAAGRKLIEKAFRVHASVMEDIGKSLSTEERAVLIELLTRSFCGPPGHRSTFSSVPRGLVAGDQRATSGMAIASSPATERFSRWPRF